MAWKRVLSVPSRNAVRAPAAERTGFTFTAFAGVPLIAAVASLALPTSTLMRALTTVCAPRVSASSSPSKWAIEIVIGFAACPSVMG
jgi:hypothetical protein